MAKFDDEIASPSVSPDGSRIVVRALEMSADLARPTASRLVVVPTSTAPTSRLSSPPDVFPFRVEWVSNEEILYTAKGALWQHRLGDEPTRIPFEARVTLNRPSYRRRAYEFPERRERRDVRGFVRPVVAPVFSTLAFAALGDIWVLPPLERVPVPITRDEYLDTDPHWSPDGRFIVFSSDRLGTMDLWIKDVEAPTGTGERSITSSTGVEISPAWSPDGRKIAYVDEQSQLHVLHLEGNEDRRLTTPRLGVGIPSWSSDSLHVALSVHVPLSERYREGYNRILVVDTSTGQARLLEQPEGSFGGRDGDGPVWSPSGDALAFAMDGGLWLMPVETDGTPTGRAKRLVGEAIDFPSWSPDGRRIVFVGTRGLQRVDVASGEVSDLEAPLGYETRSAGGQLLIRNVRVIDGTGAPPEEGMDVLLRGNRIESIEPTGAENPENLRVIEGTGKTLIPGLIEMHTHLSLPAWGSRHGKVWLAYGITSVRTPADSPLRALEERESTLSGRRIGPRMFLTGSTMDGSFAPRNLSKFRIAPFLKGLLGADRALRVDGFRLKTPTRVGLYKVANNMPAGWLMWLFESYDFDFRVMSSVDFEGDLSEHYDVIVLPSGTTRCRMMEGLSPSLHDGSWRWAYGVGETGLRELRRFVETGGTLVAIGSAVETARELFGLPIEPVLPKLPPRFQARSAPTDWRPSVPAEAVDRVVTETSQSPAALAKIIEERVVEPTSVFYGPGSLLDQELDVSHPVADGMPERWPVFFRHDQAYRLKPSFEVRAQVVTRYPDEGDLVESGWLLGGERLRDQANVVSFEVSEGSVVTGDVPAAVEFGRVAAAPVNTLRQQPHRCQEISVCF